MVSTSCKDANDTTWNWGYQVLPGEEKDQSSGLVLNNNDIARQNMKSTAYRLYIVV